MNPFDWRQRSGPLTWRIATPPDIEILRDIQAHADSRINPSMLPDLDQKPVLLTMVAENEHGEVVYGAYIENVAHIRAIGVHKAGLRSLLGLKPMLRGFLRAAGFRMVKINFRRQLTFAVRPLLVEAGFDAEDEQGPNFQYMLR